MKLVHLADTHLGFQQYDRRAPNGVNQREVDVAQTVSRAFDQIITEQPDIIVIGGDVFHATRPTNNTINLAFGMFLRLRKALPNTPIVIVSGNHDAPKTADNGNILKLFRKIGNCHVIESAAEWLGFPELELDLLCVPDVIGLQRPELKPRDPSIKHRVLLMHGEIAGVMALPMPHDIPLIDLHGDAWSYIALGHYHVYREVAPHTYYSGSLDYTSSNPWGELKEEAEREVPGKGFIVQDLDTGVHRFVPVAVSRPWIDLAPINCAELSATDIDEALAHAVDAIAGGIDGKIVRAVLLNMPRSRMQDLNQQAIREYKSRALQFQLDTRKPEERAIALEVSTSAKRVTLRDTLTGYMEACPLPVDIDRRAFVALSQQYFQQAGDVNAAVADSNMVEV